MRRHYISQSELKEIAKKRRLPTFKVETIKEFLKRGGKIQIIPFGKFTTDLKTKGDFSGI